MEVDVEAKLSGDDHPVADGFEGLYNKLLVGEWPIGFRGIEQRYSPLVRRADKLDLSWLVGRWTVESTHTHAAQTKRRDFKTALSELPLLHRWSPFIGPSQPFRLSADPALYRPCLEFEELLLQNSI
jgi:hypothetical protein